MPARSRVAPGAQSEGSIGGLLVGLLITSSLSEAPVSCLLLPFSPSKLPLPPADQRWNAPVAAAQSRRGKRLNAARCRAAFPATAEIPETAPHAVLASGWPQRNRNFSRKRKSRC